MLRVREGDETYAPGDVADPKLLVVGAGDEAAFEEDGDAVLRGECLFGVFMVQSLEVVHEVT